MEFWSLNISIVSRPRRTTLWDSNLARVAVSFCADPAAAAAAAEPARSHHRAAGERTHTARWTSFAG